MDIITHISIGAAMGTVVAGFCKSGGGVTKTGIVLSGALGGFLPDIDAVSLWSGFDGTFGKLFGLQHKRSVIYSSKFWYSHHAFMYSLLAAVTIGFLFLLISYLFQQKIKKLAWQSFGEYEQQSKNIQKKFLGNKLYRRMERFDNAISRDF